MTLRESCLQDSLRSNWIQAPSRECPLWIISGHRIIRCPLYTWSDVAEVSTNVRQVPVADSWELDPGVPA